MQEIGKAGPYAPGLKDLPPGTYEVHAIVRHPLLTIYGADLPITLITEEAGLRV